MNFVEREVERQAAIVAATEKLDRLEKEHEYTPTATAHPSTSLLHSQSTVRQVEKRNPYEGVSHEQLLG